VLIARDPMFKEESPYKLNTDYAESNKLYGLQSHY